MIPASDGAAISLVGDITWQSSEMLRDRIASLIDQGRRNIVISLSDVSYVDSSGLAVLLSAFRRLHLLKGRFSSRGGFPDFLRRLQFFPSACFCHLPLLFTLLFYTEHNPADAVDDPERNEPDQASDRI